MNPGRVTFEQKARLKQILTCVSWENTTQPRVHHTHTSLLARAYRLQRDLFFFFEAGAVRAACSTWGCGINVQVGLWVVYVLRGGGGSGSLPLSLAKCLPTIGFAGNFSRVCWKFAVQQALGAPRCASFQCHLKVALCARSQL